MKTNKYKKIFGIGPLGAFIREELMMAEIFGDAYRKYANRTGRFFPRMF
jgi:protein-S-isoprenylcysteine O-methyltransferase Ste14